MAKVLPSADRVRALLNYDPDSGVFTWKDDRSSWRGGRFLARAGDVAGGPTVRNGWVIHVDGKQYKAHRMAWLVVYGAWPEKMIDHRDGNNLNNAISNLRDVSGQINVQNMRRAACTNKSSGLLGVSATRSKTNPWKAQIRVDGRIQHLGSFSRKEDAHEVYVEAKRTYHPGCTI